jgi:hypothetical protein
MYRLLLFALPWLAAASAVQAAPPSPSVYCESAIAAAERTVHLPARLLGAIAEVESGHLDEAGTLRPWPWTINAEGRGQFFATKADAVGAVRALQARGVRSIDVGCMQVNLMYHPNAFDSLDEAFDPTSNAFYAARFLNALYGASGSWVMATAAYHSETPSIGVGYQRKVMARLKMPGAPAVVTTAYGMFEPASSHYADFQPMSRVYGDFAPSDRMPARFAQR